MKETSKTYKPAHGVYPDAHTRRAAEPARVPGTTIPTTTCACGQVPICHGLRTCGMKD
jgi:hypothetical protein